METLDWIVCTVYMLLVLLLGWWCSRGPHTNDEYLVGSRQMNWFAIGVSLFATTFSALSFVGLPREAAYEDYHLYLAILFIPLFSAPIVAIFFIPVYHRLQLISAYEYLERRFDRRLRLIGSLLSCLYTLGWMGSMLFATGLILQAVLDLTDDQFRLALIGLGIFATMYTAVGGFKAVVWTDVIQSVVLFGGMLLVLVLTLQALPGGWTTVWEVGQQHHKFEMFDYQWDLTQRGNMYAAAAYGVFVYLAAQATAQGAVQRYVSMPTVHAARLSLVVNGVLTAGVCLVFFLVGSAMFAYYHHNAPAGTLATEAFPKLAKADQLMPYFIREELQFPGLMGTLMAGLFAAVMSSVDSGVNSMTSLVVCDWLAPDEQGGQRAISVKTSKALCGLFGALAIALSIAFSYIGGHVFDLIIAISGAMFGPLLGVFTLGMFVRRANSQGALMGMLTGAICLAWVYTTPVSGWWHGAFTCIPTFFVGLFVSWLTAAPAPEKLGILEQITPATRSPEAELPGPELAPENA